MSVIKVIENVKKIHKEDVLIVKIGNFYYSYGKDSYIISYLFNYKVGITKEKIYFCSYPQNALNKVIAKLENSKINYIILDRRNEYSIDEKYDFKNLNRYNEIYEKAKQKIRTKMRIEEIYNYILQNENDKELILEIENVINEKRKIQSN